jgi:hypothetical protein
MEDIASGETDQGEWGAKLAERSAGVAAGSMLESALYRNAFWLITNAK